MNTVFVKSFDEPEINTDEILRYAGCKTADEGVVLLLEECLAEVIDKLVYKVCYIELDSIQNHGSQVLESYLSDCSSIIVFAATVGIEIDRLISKYAKISPSKAHMLQAIGAERVESLCDMFCNFLSGDTKPRISAGYGDIPLEMQRELVDILDCSRKIGVTLTESCLMVPSKSVTGFIGVKNESFRFS